LENSHGENNYGTAGRMDEELVKKIAEFYLLREELVISNR